jgi:hypothetical protein
MWDKTMVQLKKVEEAVKPVGAYIHHRRGRFSALGTVIVLYPWLRRPHHTWAEFEKDFRMYDQQHKK